MKKIVLCFLLVIHLPVYAEKDCTSRENPCDDPTTTCVYQRQISMKQQLLFLYGNQALRDAAYNRALSELPGNDEVTRIMREHRARKYFQEKIEALAHDGRTIKLKRCKGEEKIESPFGQFTDRDCNTHYEDFNGNEVTKEEALARNTCSEFNSAAKIHELFHKAECEKAKSTHKDRETLDNYIIEEMQAYYHEVEYLKEERAFQKAHCTPTSTHGKKARAKTSKLLSSIVGKK